MTHGPDSKIQALLQLLSDPNEQVAQTIQHELVAIGPSVLPFLSPAQHKHPHLEPRLAFVREEIQFCQLKEEFQGFVSRSGRQTDWEEGAFLIARLGYPELLPDPFIKQLDLLAEEFRQKWQAPETATGKAAKLLSAFLFKDKGFSGNQGQYYDPDNSYLHRVLETRQGIPITLSALYVFVGNRVGIPLAGVGMPGHFLVMLEGESPPQFVDCFNGGTILQKQDCEKFLAASGLAFQPKMLEKSTTRNILLRMLRNLLQVYQQDDHTSMTRRIEVLIEMIEAHSSDTDRYG